LTPVAAVHETEWCKDEEAIKLPVRGNVAFQDWKLKSDHGDRLGSGSFPSLCSPCRVPVLVWVSVGFRDHLRGLFSPSVPHAGSPFLLFFGGYY